MKNLPDECALLHSLLYIRIPKNDIINVTPELHKLALFDQLQNNLMTLLMSDYREIIQISKNRRIFDRELHYPDNLTLCHNDRAVHYNISNTPITTMHCYHNMTMHIYRYPWAHNRSKHIPNEYLLCTTKLYTKLYWLQINTNLIYEDYYTTSYVKSEYNIGNLPYALKKCDIVNMTKYDIKTPYRCKIAYEIETHYTE